MVNERITQQSLPSPFVLTLSSHPSTWSSQIPWSRRSD